MDCLSLQLKGWSVLDQVLQFELEPSDQSREEVEIAETADNDGNASDRLELDDLIMSVKLAAAQFIEKINNSTFSWNQFNEPLEVRDHCFLLLKKIGKCKEALQDREESISPLHFLRSKLGFGEYVQEKKKLTELQHDLKIHFCIYFERLKKVAEREFARGFVLQALKKYRLLEQVLPESSDVIDRIGDCYFTLNQKEKASDYYEKLLKKNVRPISSKFKKAKCLLDAGKASEANVLLAELSQNTKVQQVMLCREVTKNEIASKIELGKYLEAIDDSDQAIERHPQEDAFKLSLIDAYLGYGDLKLFSTNFQRLSQYFSKQSCYSIMSCTFGDTVQIVLDFFDYIAQKSKGMYVLFTEYVMRTKPTEQFVDIVLSHFERKFDDLIEKKNLLNERIKLLFQLIESSEFQNSDEIDLLREKLLECSEELVGGQRADCHVGLLNYLQFYSECLGELTKNAAYQHLNFENLFKKRDQLRADLHTLCNKIFQESETDVGLRQLFQKRLIQTQARNVERGVDEEAIELIRQGHLMKFIELTLVPRENRDEVLKYLEEKGIDLELLFQSKLLALMPKEPLLTQNVQKELHAAIIHNEKIDTIDALKKYIHE